MKNLFFLFETLTVIILGGVVLSLLLGADIERLKWKEGAFLTTSLTSLESSLI